MIRQDFVLRMIDGFAQTAAQIEQRQKCRHYEEAFAILEDGVDKLTASRLEEILRFDQVELLSRLVGQDATIVGRYKIVLLAFLLKQAGDLAKELNKPNNAYYLIGLDLLLELFSIDEEIDDKEIPKIDIDTFAETLRGVNLPISTSSSLMEYYESKFEFSKAEAAFNQMLQANPDNSRIVRLGIAFYRRLENQNDATINAEHISRQKIATNLNQLCAKERTLGDLL